MPRYYQVIKKHYLSKADQSCATRMESKASVSSLSLNCGILYSKHEESPRKLKTKTRNECERDKKNVKAQSFTQFLSQDLQGRGDHSPPHPPFFFFFFFLN